MRKQNNKPGLFQPEAKPPRPHHWKPEKSAASWVKRDIETQNIVRVMAGFVISAVIIAALYFGQDVLIPLALAILLAFLLEPLVSRLKKWGLPQLPSIAIVMIFTISVLAGLGSYLGFQLKDLSQELPQYQDTIQQKLNTVKSLTSGPSAWDGAKTTFDTVESSFEGINQVEQEKGVQNVKVVGLEQSPSDAAMEWGSKILSPIATIGIVFLFVVLILISRKDLHDRLLRLLGSNLNIGTDVLDEAGQRIGTYLRMQLLVNVTYGIPMASGLWFIGVPAAIMWGMLAVVLRFVPYVGPIISAVFPLTLAFAVDPGWNMFLWTLGLILLLELISNNIIEPWLYGESTGLTTLSIILAATFWTLIWGPIGLILSTPLTACLLVLSHYIPALGFVKVLIGSAPVLSPPERFYQRLVADEVHDALDVANAYIQQELPKKTNEEALVRKINNFYDEVAIPAICLFSQVHNTEASAEHRLRMHQGLKRFNHEFQQQYPLQTELNNPKVMCLGARWEVDVLASAMLAHGLNLKKIAACSHADALIQSRSDVLSAVPESTDIICITIFHQQPMAQIRLLNHRIRTLKPQIKLVFALLGNQSTHLRDEIERLFQPEAVVNSVNELMLSMDMLLMAQGENPAAALLHDNEPERLQTLHELDLLQPELLPIYSQYIEEARQAFDVKYAQISLVDAGQVHTPASPLAEAVESAIHAAQRREESICTHLVYQNEALVIEDIQRDPRFRQYPHLARQKIRFYAGVPIQSKQGLAIGSLCILDKQVRQMSEEDLDLLKALALDLQETLSSERLRKQKLEEIQRLGQADLSQAVVTDS